jgi:FAD/FMN-containing dehydrogenase
VQRFADMMEEMCYIVATKHSGSLKGEHGTGRNVAPFVEMEWGTKVRHVAGNFNCRGVIPDAQM